MLTLLQLFQIIRQLHHATHHDFIGIIAILDLLVDQRRAFAAVRVQIGTTSAFDDEDAFSGRCARMREGRSSGEARGAQGGDRARSGGLRPSAG